MNRRARERRSALSGPEWFEEAVRLDAENRRLREILHSLFWWLAERDELVQLARAQIDRRWGSR